MTATRPRAAEVAHLVDRHRWLVRLRWFAVSGVAVASVVARALGVVESPSPLLAIAAMLAVLNGYWSTASLGDFDEQSLRRRLFRQLVCDLVALAALLHWSGGAENPTSTFFAFPIALGAILLLRRQGLLLVLCAAVLYGGLLVGELTGVLSHHPLMLVRHVPGAFSRSPVLVLGQAVAILPMMAGVYYFVRAVVEQQWRAEALRHEHERIAISRERLARVGEISAGIAHAVRNPLHGLISCVDLLTAKTNGDETMRETLALMSEALGRIERTTGRMLDLTRDVPLALTPADIDALVVDTLALVSPNARGSAARIETHLGHAGNADVDALRVSEALINVVSNAVDACSGGGTITVRTSAGPPGDSVIVDIEDTGTGIALEHLDKVFTPFFTTKAIGEGSGLGLAVTRRIIDEHGGSVSLQSAVGKGTKVTLVIPRRAAARAEEGEGP